ncbi:hypothetical protein [Mucisphaera sp.]|uniref:hypothetical protein n=1 Tax=Mucisphaera sp. TaxID=2913024 RepID=UPI003D0C9B40
MTGGSLAQQGRDVASDSTDGVGGWWVRLGVDEQGPMSATRVRQRLEAGLYSRWHEVSRDRRTWRSIREIMQAAEEVDAGTAGPTRHPKAGGVASGDAAWLVLLGEAVTDDAAGVDAERETKLRVAQASFGGLLFGLGLLPVAVVGGDAVSWWGWRDEAGDWGVAWLLGIWTVLGVTSFGLAMVLRLRWLSKDAALWGLSGLVWCSGWLGVFGGIGLAVVGPVWLLGVAMLFVRLRMTRTEHVSVRPLAVVILLLWVASLLTGYGAVWVVAASDPVRAGGELVRCVIFASGMTGLACLVCWQHYLLKLSALAGQDDQATPSTETTTESSL